MFLRGFFIVMMFLPLAGAYASDTTEDRDKVIDEFMEASGLNHQIEQLPAMINAGMQQGRNGMDEDTFAQVSAAMGETHTAQAFTEEIKSSLNKSYDKVRFTALLALVNSPFAQKMTQLEKEASTPEVMQHLQAYAATLDKDPPAPSRIALIERLDKAAGATSTAMNIQLQTAQTMISVLDPLLPAEQRMKPEQKEEMLWQMQLQGRPMMQQFIGLNMLYAYRSLPDKELEQYVTLHETDLGKWSADLMNRIMVAAFATLAEKAAVRVKELKLQNSGS